MRSNWQEFDQSMQDADAVSRDDWATCNLCCGEGGWEESRPQHDDPHFSIVIKCPSCGGSGWECN